MKNHNIFNMILLKGGSGTRVVIEGLGNMIFRAKESKGGLR